MTLRKEGLRMYVNSVHAVSFQLNGTGKLEISAAAQVARLTQYYERNEINMMQNVKKSLPLNRALDLIFFEK